VQDERVLSVESWVSGWDEDVGSADAVLAAPVCLVGKGGRVHVGSLKTKQKMVMNFVQDGLFLKFASLQKVQPPRLVILCVLFRIEKIASARIGWLSVNHAVKAGQSPGMGYAGKSIFYIRFKFLSKEPKKWQGAALASNLI